MQSLIMTRLRNDRDRIMALHHPARIEISEILPLRQYDITVIGISTYVKTPGEGAPERSPGPHTFAIMLPNGYPRDISPIVSFRTLPPAHPNIYRGNGNVCLGVYKPTQTLDQIVYRVLRLLLLDPSTFNFESAADSSSASFVKSGIRLPVASLAELFGEPVSAP